MEDGQLLALIKKDPQAGMDRLMDLYMGLVYTVVRGKLREPAFSRLDAEECVADVFSEFYCDLDKFSPEKGSVKGWLCAIARNTAIDRLRSRSREPEPVPREDLWIYGAEDWDETALRRELIGAIKALGEPDSQILIRKYYLGESTKQIARSLGMTVSNVDTRAHRAVARLRQCMGGEQA